MITTKGVFSWHRGDFRAGARSLRFPLMAQHLFTWYRHKMLSLASSHPGVSSPRLLYRGENFTPVLNLATVSCKSETTRRFGVKSVCWWTGKGSACVMFAILNHACILSTWSVPSKWPSHNVNAIRNQKVIPVWNSSRCEFSHVNTP